MNVTVILANGEITAHRTGCAHIKRTERTRTNLWLVNADSLENVAADAWTDMIAEGSMTPAEALAATHAAPCLDTLPTHAGPAFAARLAADDVPTAAEPAMREVDVTWHLVGQPEQPRSMRILLVDGYSDESSIPRIIATNTPGLHTENADLIVVTAIAGSAS